MREGGSRAGNAVPVILVVAEDFGSLMGPLEWLAERGYDVRACLGPLAADRVCGMYGEGCPELTLCDLLITNEPLRPRFALLPAPRELVREARLRREELPILIVGEEDGKADVAARSMTSRTVPPRKAELLRVVEDLIGPPLAIYDGS